jgi:hypothetical protein
MTSSQHLEALDNPTLFARRHEVDLGALLVSRLPTWANVWLDDKCDEYLGELPALARDEDVVVALEHMESTRLEDCNAFVRHLCRRLVRRPTPGAAPVLRRLLARAADPAQDIGHALAAAAGCAALACDPAHAVAPLLAQVGTSKETVASVCALFLADPEHAFDRLGGRLVVGATGAADHTRRQLLGVLVADGIPDTVGVVRRSAHARGFVAADPRWATALLALAPDKLLFEAKRALANVPPELLASLRPKKRGKKPLPEARLVSVGTVAQLDVGAAPFPVDVRGDLILVATSPTRVSVRRITDGLPLIADVVLPGERAFATEAVGPYDSPYEAKGVLDAVLHPDGTAFAVLAHGEVLLVGLDGTVRAEATLDDTLPHRACFGPLGQTLWVATNSDDGHAVTALDGTTLAVLGKTKNLGEFPDPAWFSAHPHPTDDVGVFAVLCGQDGAWVKVIERTARGFAPRKQKLHTNGSYAQVFGYGPGVVATGTQGGLTIRSWPELAPIKGTKLEGELRGGVVVGAHVVLAMADFTDAPSRLSLHAIEGGACVADAPWPAGESLVERATGALVTSSDAGVTVYRVELPPAAGATKRAKAGAG